MAMLSIADMLIPLLAASLYLILRLCCDRELRQRILRRHRPQDIETGPPSNSASQAQPLEEQKAAIPILAGTVVIYKNGSETKSNCTGCAICLEEFKDGDRCRVLSKCEHSYHELCIDQWLVKDRHCPLCRGSVHGSRPTTDQINGANSS